MRRWILALACLVCACSDDTSPGTAPRGAADDQDKPDVDQIRQTGYAGFSEGETDATLRGVVLCDAERSAPGYNLVSVSQLCTADLFDARGKLIHQWKDPQGRAWDHVELFENGDLVVVGSNRGTRLEAGALCEDHYVERLGFDGSRRWKSPIRAHHDVQVRPDGALVTLTASARREPGIDAKNDIVDNHIVVLSAADGSVLEEASLYDLFAAAGFPFRPVEPNAKFPIIDLFHANSIDILKGGVAAERDPVWAAGNLLICSRHQDALAVIDWKAKKLVWWWQQEISGAHDARLQENGRVLIFDNGIERGWSRVIEMDPASREIVWQYYDPDRKRFYSSGQGSSQRLANGNVLFCNSMSGQSVEITPDGQRVWEYFTPYFNEQGERATTYRIRRYDESLVRAVLSANGRTLAD